MRWHTRSGACVTLATVMLITPASCAQAKRLVSCVKLKTTEPVLWRALHDTIRLYNSRTWSGELIVWDGHGDLPDNPKTNACSNPGGKRRKIGIDAFELGLIEEGMWDNEKNLHGVSEEFDDQTVIVVLDVRHDANDLSTMILACTSHNRRSGYSCEFLLHLDFLRIQTLE